MKPCFEAPKALEEAARLAEQRKRRAIARLTSKLDAVHPKDSFERAMEALIDADRAALQARGQ